MSKFGFGFLALAMTASSALAASNDTWFDGTNRWPQVTWFDVQLKQETGSWHAATTSKQKFLQKVYSVSPFSVDAMEITKNADSQIEAQFEIEGFYPADGLSNGEFVEVKKPSVWIQLDRQTHRLIKAELASPGHVTLRYRGDKPSVYTDCTVELDRSAFKADVANQKFGFEIESACNGGYMSRNFLELTSVTELAPLK